MSLHKQHSIGREAAIELYKTEWWAGMTAQEIVQFQLFIQELAMPFGEYHRAIEEAFGRPVWTHEFADFPRMAAEFKGEQPAPTMEEILNMIPAEKRIVVIVQEQEAP